MRKMGGRVAYAFFLPRIVRYRLAMDLLMDIPEIPLYRRFLLPPGRSGAKPPMAWHCSFDRCVRDA